VASVSTGLAANTQASQRVLALWLGNHVFAGLVGVVVGFTATWILGWTDDDDRFGAEFARPADGVEVEGFLVRVEGTYAGDVGRGQQFYVVVHQTMPDEEASRYWYTPAEPDTVRQTWRPAGPAGPGLVVLIGAGDPDVASYELTIQACTPDQSASIDRVLIAMPDVGEPKPLCEVLDRRQVLSYDRHAIRRRHEVCPPPQWTEGRQAEPAVQRTCW
jgi:hypothetical protein